MTDPAKWTARDPGNRQPCPDCRPDNPCPKHCGARLRQIPGALCLQPKGIGTDHPGFGTCKRHLGSTPVGRKHAAQLKQEAWARILEMTNPALAQLSRIVESGETDAVRLAAVRDVLDRAGLGAKQVHEHTGPDGGPIPIEVRAAELVDRARALRPPVTEPDEG